MIKDCYYLCNHTALFIGIEVGKVYTYNYLENIGILPYEFTSNFFYEINLSKIEKLIYGI